MSSDAEQAAKDFIRELWSLQGVSYAVVVARYYCRISKLGWGSLSWDDVLMALATIAYTAESVMAYLVVACWKGLANNAMTDEQRSRLDPNSEEWMLRVNGSKTHVAGLLLYTTLLWMLKGCWLIYYARLTDGVHKRRRMIDIGAVIMSASYGSCLLVAFLKCIPFDHQWQINPSPGNHCMPAISFIQTIFVMVMNTITDFYLMAIPLPVIWGSHLPRRKKFVLIFMFSGGFLEMAFGILRCVSILTMGDIDPAQSGYWSVRESFVSFVLTNMPVVYPLFRDIIEKSRNVTREKSYSTSDSRGYRLGSISRQKGVPHKHPLSLPNDTAWDSNEQIIDNAEHGSASSGDNASLGLPIHRPSTRQALNDTTTTTQPNQSSSEQDPQEILVTKEYVVTDNSPDPKQDMALTRF